MKWRLILLCLLMACHENQQKTDGPENTVTIEYGFDSSPVDFTISDTLGYHLTFYKHKDSLTFKSFRFRIPDDTAIQFQSALPVLKKMWIKAEDSLSIDLKSLSIGYPLEYTDLIRRQVEVFSRSEKWNQHLENNGKKADYSLIKDIMFKKNVYPLDSLINTFGYKATGISIEKVGFVTAEKLTELGYEKDLIIPMPFMVWIDVVN